MTNTASFAASVAMLLVAATSSAKIMAAELAPHVLAQVDERVVVDRGVPRALSVRILDDGRIEALDGDKWTEVGTLAKGTLLRFKNTTAVMTAASRLSIADSGDPAEIEIVEYFVRNKSGEVVLIGKRGPQNATLMQGGATAIIRVLDGLRTLARISY